ncbi:clusterin-associated protein 1-like [Ctenocephalides felis]|uniref:clusterin-associated protein 1-like n=1 Tax=Ctenocephalides felis TaxID=7515 RepID=UPI000E6E42F0|nr:clusterin-associated protein 1-like [Ctenocephalides felis]
MLHKLQADNMPAFLDELERLEEELSAVYDKYVLYVRCQAALKAQINSNTEIDDLSQTTLNQKQGKILIPQNKNRGIPAGYDINDDDDDTDLDDLDESMDDTEDLRKMANMSLGANNKPRTRTRLRVRTGAGGDRGRIFGGMGPHGVSDNSLGNSSDSLGIGHDATEGLTDDDASLRFDEISKQPMGGPDIPDASDEDF